MPSPQSGVYMIIHLQHVCSDLPWKDNGFEDNNVMHLFCRNKDILAHNHKRMQEVGEKISLIEAENTGNARNIITSTQIGHLHFLTKFVLEVQEILVLFTLTGTLHFRVIFIETE